VSPRPAGGLGLSALADFRQRKASTAPDSERHLERADLHALLVRGETMFTIRGRNAVLGDVHLFLFAERLLALADDALEAWQLGRALFRRIELSGTRISLQRGPGDVPMSLSVSRQDAPNERLTFPEIDPGAFVRLAVRFARSLSDAFTECDPSQAKNLRLSTLISHAAALAERAEDARTDDSLTNSEPESYRSYARPLKKSESRGRWEHGGKMRFVPRWVATVPSIDLRATFLCGDRLIIGSERETACIHRAQGALLWRVPTTRAACVATPMGLARLSPDGRLTLHDLEDGQVRFATALMPRVGNATGSVVHVAGLPKLLVIAEGDRHVTAVDLVTGEVRWRHRFKSPGIQRMRRTGKLLLVSADTVLVALDVATGAVVWRIRHRLPFSGDLTLDHDSAFAVVGGAGGAQLLGFDPFTGDVRARVAIGERPASGQPPLVTPDVVAVPVRDRRGMGLVAFSRSTLEPAWSLAPGLSSATTAWLAVDGDVVGNSAAGTLLAVDGRDGAIRYSHVFPRHVEADQPRRLEPVLRSGALFVPQYQVHVVRPGDGELLGSVPTDLIPDLIRVDERCDVYVAEESGHVAAFGVAAKLTLVK
jgi:outer membrane protein assembly factor BamB